MFLTVFLPWCLLLPMYLLYIGSLHLAGNGLRGTIPTVLSRIDSLSKCFSFYFVFRPSVPFVLTCLFLVLTTTLLLSLGFFSYNNIFMLASLLLQRNKLTGTVPTWFGRLTNLRTMRLHDNRLVGSIPNETCYLVPASAGPLENLSVDCDLVTCTCGCQCN